MKTLTSGRASSVDRLFTALPSTRRRLASPGWNPASMRWAASSSRVSITTRATVAPRRTSSRSFEVRGDAPVQPK